MKLFQSPVAVVYALDFVELAARVAEVDAVVCDVPPSARCARRKEHPWGINHVGLFVDAWSNITTGWVCVLTDPWLLQAWLRGFEAKGRHVNEPVPCVEAGAPGFPAAGPRYLVAARPKRQAFARWPRTPREYRVPEGCRERLAKGEQTVWLMGRIVEDYSRASDLVCDPMCGSGATLAGALRAGRCAAGAELDKAKARRAVAAVRKPVQTRIFDDGPWYQQTTMFGGDR